MILNVTSTLLSLDDRNDFRRFKVAVPQHLDLSTIHPQGVEFEAEHCWIDVQMLKRLAADEDSQWVDAFDQMVTAAAKYGWTSADQKKLRAHIERLPESHGASQS